LFFRPFSATHTKHPPKLFIDRDYHNTTYDALHLNVPQMSSPKLAPSSFPVYRRMKNALLNKKVPPASDFQEYFEEVGDPIENSTLKGLFNADPDCKDALNRARQKYDSTTMTKTAKKSSDGNEKPRGRGRPPKKSQARNKGKFVKIENQEESHDDDESTDSPPRDDDKSYNENEDANSGASDEDIPAMVTKKLKHRKLTIDDPITSKSTPKMLPMSTAESMMMAGRSTQILANTLYKFLTELNKVVKGNPAAAEIFKKINAMDTTGRLEASGDLWFDEHEIQDIVIAPNADGLDVELANIRAQINNFRKQTTVPSPKVFEAPPGWKVVKTATGEGWVKAEEDTPTKPSKRKRIKEEQ